VQIETQERKEEKPVTKNTSTVWSAATVVLPLRLFLALAFIAAGLDKLTDPEFLDTKAGGYIENQLSAFATTSPLGGFLTDVAVPNATLFGAMVLAGELLIGLGTLVGLFSRVAAFFGLLLTLNLWLVATWAVTPFYLGNDLPYAMGWLIMLLAGPHPIYSIDGQIRKWLENRRSSENPAESEQPYGQYPVQPAMSSQVEVAADSSARRRLIAVGGATLLAGGITVASWVNTLASRNSAPASGGTVNPGNLLPTPASTTTVSNTVAGTTTTVAATTPAATTGVATTSSATTSAGSTTQAAPATTSAPQFQGKVLANLSNLPKNSALKFNTPDSGEKAVLIHNNNGSVKALGTTCTHQGCEVAYRTESQLMECPCHGARYNPENGSVVRGPATRPLKNFNVQVDGSGNIVYIQG
jgi:thiosulfate dehydrogenase [quinone] large subunit